MTQPTNLYKRHRFAPAIIQQAVWLYHRFNLSHGDMGPASPQHRPNTRVSWADTPRVRVGQ